MWPNMLIANLLIKFDVIGSGPLKIMIKFDNQIIFDQHVGDQNGIVTVNQNFLNLPKTHELIIDIDGKTHDMTVMDENNNIISDTVFRIQQVSLNHIDIGEMFYLNAQYQHTHNGYSDPVTQPPSDISGFNGQIKWNFFSPVHRWLYQQGVIDTPGWIQRIQDAWPQVSETIQRKILNTTGINIKTLFKIFYFPKYIGQLVEWKQQGGRVDGYDPILADYSGTFAGVGNGAYFYQDIMVANHILTQKPKRHVTIGSNVTGFVGHVATFMPITVCDLRPLGTISYPNIDFVQRDLGDPTLDHSDLVADSVSCLSCLHHIGIGRYGDPINPDGPFLALAHFQQIVAPGGILYIGTGIGPTSRVVFNSTRQFTVQEILKHLPNFDLVRFDYYNPIGNVIRQHVTQDQFAEIPEYSYGIFVLKSKLK